MTHPQNKKTKPGQALILDMYSLAWKFYHTQAYKPLTDKNHQPSGMTYGVLLSIVKLIKRFPKATMIMCAYDYGHSERELLYPKYKANRKHGEDKDYKAPFLTQLATLMNLLEALGYHKLGEFNVEADDLIAIYTKEWIERSKENKAIIVSRDSDLYQLLRRPTIGFYNHHTGNYHDMKNIHELIEVTPKQYPFYKALLGDTADNIPRCVNKAVASKLIAIYPDKPHILLQHKEAFDEATRKQLITNLSLILLPYKKMPQLTKHVDLTYELETDFDTAQHILDDLNIKSFGLADLLLKHKKTEVKAASSMV